MRMVRKHGAPFLLLVVGIGFGIFSFGPLGAECLRRRAAGL